MLLRRRELMGKIIPWNRYSASGSISSYSAGSTNTICSISLPAGNYILCGLFTLSSGTASSSYVKGRFTGIGLQLGDWGCDSNGGGDNSKEGSVTDIAVLTQQTTITLQVYAQYAGSSGSGTIYALRVGTKKSTGTSNLYTYTSSSTTGSRTLGTQSLSSGLYLVRGAMADNNSTSGNDYTVGPRFDGAWNSGWQSDSSGGDASKEAEELGIVNISSTANLSIGCYTKYSMAPGASMYILRIGDVI